MNAVVEPGDALWKRQGQVSRLALGRPSPGPSRGRRDRKIVIGTAGYFGLDWIADHIDAN
ncbi:MULTISPECIES: hypothetical protein [Ralstonia solanacearum species complex]|uniref:hypothetical protein n=1 Tax=Ralstonia solanacearum species complex TaxID=3116862 RepID=UPI000A4EF981|nr:hypothetical protein [Ralstonia solanacearum]MDN4065277.1 hypothetical protein [Ralstonia solanacearum]NUU72684.1 hypothetical protein [Ralstonia solanacearum]